MIRVRVDSGYERGRGKLSKDDRRRADRALERLLQNPRHPGLNMEKLKGRFENYYTIRASRSIRILLRRELDGDDEIFAAVDVGTCDVIYRLSARLSA